MKSLKSAVLLSLVFIAPVSFIVSTFKQSTLAVGATAPLATSTQNRLQQINFSCLGGMISALGPVTLNEVDTTELYSIRAQTAEAWKKLRPRSIAREQQIASDELLRAEADMLYQFTTKYPSSFWTPAIQSRLGTYYRMHGGYSRALDLLRLSWESTKSFNIAEIKQVADFSLAQYVALLTRLGRFETLTDIFEETADRRLPYGSDADVYLKAREAYAHMKIAPGTSYRCGTFALANAANVEFNSKRSLLEIKSFDSPTTGFTVQTLREISDQLNWGFVPVFWNGSTGIVVPSVVHWKANHYAAITAKHGSWYTVIDPTFDGAPVLLHEKDILAEATGVFLVPANKVPANWTRLRADEQSQFVGRGYDTFATDNYDEPTCPNGSGSGGAGGVGIGPGLGKGGGAKIGSACSSCGAGMPIWRVSEPYANLWLTDVPLAYQPAIGPEFAVRLMYRQRGSEMYLIFPSYRFSQIGKSWNFPWRSAIYFSIRSEDGSQTFHLFTPAGSHFTYNFTDSATISDAEYFTHATLERVIDPLTSELTSVVVHFPDGAYDVYGLVAVNDYGFANSLALTSRFDSQGHETQIDYFTYDPATQNTVINRIIDPDGHDLAFTYDTADGRTNYVTQITDYASRFIKLKIDLDYNTLLEITDAVDITNKISYDFIGLPTTLITPYGTNTFDIAETRADHTEKRVITVTEPTGGKQRYMYWTSDSFVPDAIDPNEDGYSTPSGTPYDAFTWWNVDGNTFYWDAANFPNLSTDFKSDPINYSPTGADRLIARGRHWIGTYVTDGVAFGQTLAVEIDPSPDGVTEGKITWYDYAGKSSSEYAGTEIKPAVIARIMPDSTVWYKYTTYNSLGHPLDEIEKWVENGTPTYRTNSYLYSTDGIDLVEHRFKATGVDKRIAGYGYSDHQPTSMTNALGEIATWTYNATNQLITYKNTSGMVSSNTYGSNGYISKTVIFEDGIGPVSTNEYTWLNGDLQTHTDPRGLTITNTWDGLRRLTKVEFPDSSYIQHAYTNGAGAMLIDRTYTRDRMANVTKWTYTPLRKVETVTDPNGIVTLYQYCDCGSLESVTRAHGTGIAETTEYFYDKQMRLLETDFPDGSWKTNSYDLLGRVVTVTDLLGITTNTFDNLSRSVASSNAFGQIFSTGYDAEGNVTSRTDANGVTVAMTYDDLDRIRTRTYPDSGVEAWGYTANVTGPTSYTNQLSKVTTYGYDKLGRKTTESVVGLATTTFTFSPASDLLTLTDGKSQTTTWAYDLYGRIATKKYADGNTNLIYSYDASSRLTNRWSAAKGNTKYLYDPNGNLLKIDYPSSTDVLFAYDELNRITQESVTNVFTSSYAYHPGGALKSEDGPWTSDTITYYTNSAGLRSGFSIQQPVGSFTNGYAYDAGHRITNVTSHAGSFAYDYYPTSAGVSNCNHLVRKVTLPPGSYITNSFDNNARQTETRLMTSGNSELNDHAYVYNVGSQRTQQTYTDNAYVTYAYDDAGELRTAYTTNSGVEVAAQRYMYGYDAAWNMEKRTNNTGVTSYTVNNLNQNTSSFAYDANGNPTNNNSLTTLTYDDENRLTSVFRTINSNPTKTEFQYDARGRLRVRNLYNWNTTSSSWIFNSGVRYIYDGMLVVQERTSGNTPQVTYTRGPDLSATLQRGGGIGGMLARSTGYTGLTGAWTTHQFYHGDANGNITYLMNSAETLAASYRYDPFGRTITSTGTSASANTYRFSSKEAHTADVFSLYYYGYRFYDPSSGRWLNRDPLSETGFQLIRYDDAVGGVEPCEYRFVMNAPTAKIDAWGLFPKLVGGGLCRVTPTGFTTCIISCVTWDVYAGYRTFTMTGTPSECLAGGCAQILTGGWGVPTPILKF